VSGFENNVDGVDMTTSFWRHLENNFKINVNETSITELVAPSGE